MGAGRIECPRSITPGVTATIDCKIGYKKYENVQKEFVCQENGEWNGQPYECKASCGQVVVNSKSLVLEMEKSNPLEVPWNAAIHKNGTHFCGGTIVSGLLLYFYSFILLFQLLFILRTNCVVSSPMF